MELRFTIVDIDLSQKVLTLLAQYIRSLQVYGQYVEKEEQIIILSDKIVIGELIPVNNSSAKMTIPIYSSFRKKFSTLQHQTAIQIHLSGSYVLIFLTQTIFLEKNVLLSLQWTLATP